MKVKRMDLAWISVADIEKSKKFFTEVLGLKISSASEQYPWAELVGQDGGAFLGMGEYNEEYADECASITPGKNAIMTMSVDDIEVMKKTLVEKGVTLIGDILEVPGHVKMLTFIDPDNNIFQVVQDLSK